MVMQVLNLENWQDAFYGTVHAVGWALPVVFFVSWIILGQYILLSLFLAIVMSKFEEKNRDEVLARQVSDINFVLMQFVGKVQSLNFSFSGMFFDVAGCAG